MDKFKDEFQEAARNILETARGKIEQDALEKATRLAGEVVESSMNEVESNIADMLLLIKERIDKETKEKKKESNKGAKAKVEAGNQVPDIVPGGGEESNEEDEDKENNGRINDPGHTSNLWPWGYPAADIRYREDSRELSISRAARREWNEETEMEEKRKMQEEQRRDAERRENEENQADACSWQRLARKLAKKAEEEDVSLVHVLETLAGHWDGNDGKRKLKEALWRYTEQKIKEHIGRMGLAERKRHLENEGRLKMTILRIEQGTFGVQIIGEDHRAHRLDRIKLVLSEHKSVKMTPENKLHIEWGSLLCLIWPGEGRHPRDDNFGDKFSLR